MKSISLYSGAGGLDVGFKKAGFNVLWANDFNKDACESYKANLGDHVVCGDIEVLKEALIKDFEREKLDVIFGGPPCQGFSVAGKMDPNDPRSKHIWTFAEIVDRLKPRAFVMENVKALGALKKWEPLRTELLNKFRDSGYATNFIVLNATEFDVPQGRERVFFIGFRNNSFLIPDLEKMILPYKKSAVSVRETLACLDKAGTGNNTSICKAKITLTSNPVLRKSPYAGMLFNGLGRPIRLNGYCATLPASMGGNKTPIIDEEELYEHKDSWVENYHADLMMGKSPLPSQDAPSRLRRLTVEEAGLIQTFPMNHHLHGSQSSKFRQIGNAVPCNLGYRVGKMMVDYLVHEEMEKVLLSLPFQMEIKY